MPWSQSDATGFTKSANTVTKKKKWAKVANSILKKTGSDAKAIRIANSMVKRGKK